MYKIDDLIIYGEEGVCRVIDIGKPGIPGIDASIPYYTLEPLYKKQKIYTPVDTKIYNRPVISSYEAERLIGCIPTIKSNIPENQPAKILSKLYGEYFNNHDCRDLIELIKGIYSKKIAIEGHGKKLTQTDEKFMKKAEDLLNGEFAAALGIPKESINDYIGQKIASIEREYKEE